MKTPQQIRNEVEKEKLTKRGTIRKIRFTNTELKWIERTADIESAIAMNRFTSLMNTKEIEKLEDKEKEMVKDISKELIDLYLFLRNLRTKLELWDCRYDIGTEFEVIDKK